MTTTNRELFYRDPTETKIPNDGFAQVVRPETEQQWQVLDWELRRFVCEGEYEQGLERILDSFLRNLGQAQQPAVWVSGFYGSGKSHLCRVLEYLWRDVTLPSGDTARSVVDLPLEISAHFKELSTQGTRHGGLWSAAGTLGAGKSQQVRLALLSVLFESAGLPKKYPLARFTFWAKDNGYLESVTEAVEGAGKKYEREIQHLYVSSIIAEALLEADPTLGDSVKDVRGVLKAQFPPQTEDVTDEELFDTIGQVLQLQSDTDGRYPLTLVMLDEMQQYLGNDNEKTLAVQNIVEGVSARFDSSILFLATGQSAMGGTPTLQKLTDRFPVHVQLSDKDVETVVRNVILRKKPDRVGELEQILEEVSGEIDRHLGGTRIEPKAADRDDLIPDYPLLPTRRRFWNLALRALDKAGKAGVLRTQLRIVHEATRDVADERAGHVVGADFLYEQQAPILQQSGELLKEVGETILALKDEGEDGELKSRICAVIFLINSIPRQMMGQGETGLRATAPYIADLLVEALRSGGAQMRKRVPMMLEQLVTSGRLMRIDDEYRLQTKEGEEWEKEYRRRFSANRDDPSKIATLRGERLYQAVESVLGGLKLTQGKSNAPREIELHFGQDEPTGAETDVPVWVRDEWTLTAASVRNSAAQAGEEDPVVHVLLPKRDTDTIKDALASHAAAKETAQSKPTPQTDEGKEAQRAMKGRIEAEEERLSSLFDQVIEHARVYQGGGNEVSASAVGLRPAVEAAARNSLVRLFPKFDAADHPSWGKVVAKARDGAPDSLKEVGYSNEVSAHPVCKEVLASVSAAGTKGTEIRARFSNPPFGWPRDAIRGALMALLATHHIRAARDGLNLTGPQELEPRQIGSTTFYKEDAPPTVQQRMAVRGLLTAAGVPYENSQEQTQIPALLQKLEDLASEAGGPLPLPEPPVTSHISDLRAQAGNQQFRAVADAHEELKANLEEWRQATAEKDERLRRWQQLNVLLEHARDLDEAKAVWEQRDAIRDGRQLLDDPDPVKPLLEAIVNPLRKAFVDVVKEAQAHYREVIGNLEMTEQWTELADSARASILRDVGLREPDDVDVSTKEALQAALNETPLRSWEDRREVMDARARRARELAAKRLEPEAVRLSVSAATFKTAEDVDAYLEELRGRIQKHLDDGHPVII